MDEAVGEIEYDGKRSSYGAFYPDSSPEEGENPYTRNFCLSTAPGPQVKGWHPR